MFNVYSFYDHRHTVSVNWVCGEIITQWQYDAVLLTFFNDMTGVFQKHRIFSWSLSRKWNGVSPQRPEANPWASAKYFSGLLLEQNAKFSKTKGAIGWNSSILASTRSYLVVIGPNAICSLGFLEDIFGLYFYPNSYKDKRSSPKCN